MNRLLRFLLHEKVAILFFLLYFVLGMVVLRDYGVSWDELYQDTIGQFNLQYVMGQNTYLLDSTNTAKFAAPAYEMFVAASAPVFGIDVKKDQSTLYYRHIVNFVTFFIGVIFFYLLCRHIWKNTYIALLGATILILTPRLFADQFYNSKDTVFLAFFVVTFYFFVRFLQKKSWGNLLRLALCTGLSFGVRIAIIFIPLFTGMSFVLDYAWRKTATKTYARDMAMFLGYGLITAFVVYATYPVLWSNPVSHFLAILGFFHQQPNDVPNLYFGQYVSAFSLPWHFIPVWIAISTPPAYLVLFLAGTLGILLYMKKNIGEFYRTHRDNFFVFLWFFSPLVLVIATGTALYNSWRHLFFVYPAFIVIAIHGVAWITDAAKRYVGYTTARFVISVLLLFNFAFVVQEMIVLHPYEHLYFNFLVGHDMRDIRRQFDTDYWGLTYRKGLEFLARYDASSSIIVIADFPGWSNAFILSAYDQERIFVGFPWDVHNERPKYFMTNFFFSQKQFPGYKEIYAVTVKGANVLKVYEIPESANVRFDGTFVYR